jgi:acyl-CoA reductase-like NAD-dependent aldehyde dehydrogenase
MASARIQASTKANSNGKTKESAPERLPVQKTYKIYIGGKFPRTESGRFLRVDGPGGEHVANICFSSRKDFREAVVVARKAFESWSMVSAFNRSQILYRIAEMLEGRKTQFIEEQVALGTSAKVAEKDILDSIDRLIYYAGWADKFQQVFSSVNPVSSSHFNFSMLEPTGVVTAIAPDDKGLLGLVSIIAPVICGGNTIIVSASEKQPLNAISFAEVLNSSDVPGGVVNILTGKASELIGHYSSHMDVNAIIYARNDKAQENKIRENAVRNIKRSYTWYRADWAVADGANPYYILDCQETKTTWHPVGI